MKDEIISGQSCSSALLHRNTVLRSRSDTLRSLCFLHSSAGGATEDQCGVAAHQEDQRKRLRRTTNTRRFLLTLQDARNSLLHPTPLLFYTPAASHFSFLSILIMSFNVFLIRCCVEGSFCLLHLCFKLI